MSEPILEQFEKKRVRVDALIAVLAGLPAGSFIEANAIGNLLVTSPDDVMLGYIDLMGNPLGTPEYVPVEVRDV